MEWKTLEEGLGEIFLTEEGRRQYLSDRLAGLPSPPPFNIQQGETPDAYLASRLRKKDVPWADDVLGTFRLMFKERLDGFPLNITEADANILGGLLSLAIRIQDGECKTFLQSRFSNTENYSSFILLASHFDTLYGSLGDLINYLKECN